MLLSYHQNFESKRADGRFVSTAAAHMAILRDIKPELTLPEELTPEQFCEWQKKIKEKHTEFLCMPKKTPQPRPTMLSSVQRVGYRVEKWEFYPDDYSAVPFLALIPDCASKTHPVPAVMCFPGTNHSKEFLAGEPLIDHPNCVQGRFPERNKMAWHYVKAGMAAFAFDNPCFAECSILTAPEYGENQSDMMSSLFAFNANGIGLNYLGVSTFQKLCFMDHLHELDYVDQERIAVSGHSLGVGAAVSLALICEEIKAVVFNDFLCDELRRIVAITEHQDRVFSCLGNAHMVPGLLRSHNFPEICAALAPRWLAINEGGAEEVLDIVRRAYKVCDAEERLQITYYPKFADTATRTVHGDIPKSGLSYEDFYEKYSHVDATDHSFRAEPSLRLLKRCFFGAE